MDKRKREIEDETSDRDVAFHSSTCTRHIFVNTVSRLFSLSPFFFLFFFNFRPAFCFGRGLSSKSLKIVSFPCNIPSFPATVARIATLPLNFFLRSSLVVGHDCVFSILNVLNVKQPRGQEFR